MQSIKTNFSKALSGTGLEVLSEYFRDFMFSTLDGYRGRPRWVGGIIKVAGVRKHKTEADGIIREKPILSY